MALGLIVRVCLNCAVVSNRQEILVLGAFTFNFDSNIRIREVSRLKSHHLVPTKRIYGSHDRKFFF